MSLVAFSRNQIRKLLTKESNMILENKIPAYESLERKFQDISEFGDWFLECYTDTLRSQQAPLFRRLAAGINLILAFAAKVYLIGERYGSRRSIESPGYLIYDEKDAPKLGQSHSIEETIEVLQVTNVIFWRELALSVESYLHREFAYGVAEQAVRKQADQIGIAYVELPSVESPDHLSSEIVKEIDDGKVVVIMDNAPAQNNVKYLRSIMYT